MLGITNSTTKERQNKFLSYKNSPTPLSILIVHALDAGLPYLVHNRPLCL